jgi:hypothetical protein
VAARPKSAYVVAPGLGEPRPAAARQHGLEATAVGGARHALDQASRREPVDEPGHPAPAQERRVGELGHSHPPARCVLEQEQRLVRRERQVPGGDELGVELLHERGVRTEESAPGAQFERREPFAGRGAASPI